MSFQYTLVKHRQTALHHKTLHHKTLRLGTFLLGALVLFVGLTTLSAVSEAQLLSSLGDVAPESRTVRSTFYSLIDFIRGSLGAMIMVLGGLGAIVASAMGAYRASVTLVTIAAGAFILRSFLDLVMDGHLREFIDPSTPALLNK